MLKSYSKINLSLSIIKKFKDRNLHQLQSFYCLINIFDEIEINKNNLKKDIVKFSGKFSRHTNNKKNSIIDILKILRKNKLISSYYSIYVNKKIPVFSGMGGGTSNAACITKHLLTKKKHNKILSQLMSIKGVGTDLRLFFCKQGFLKKIDKIVVFKKKYKLHFLVVYPNVRCSTRQIYSKVKKFSPVFQYNSKKNLRKSEFLKILVRKNNDLQTVVFEKYPAIKRLIVEIQKQKGCYFSRMTGSGSICYGVFESNNLANQALKSLKSKHPKYWCAVAKTI